MNLYGEYIDGILKKVWLRPGPGHDVPLTSDHPDIIDLRNRQKTESQANNEAIQTEKDEILKFRDVDLNNLTNDQLKKAVKYLILKELRKL